jgi:hypothetical protein
MTTDTQGRTQVEGLALVRAAGTDTHRDNAAGLPSREDADSPGESSVFRRANRPLTSDTFRYRGVAEETHASDHLSTDYVVFGYRQAGAGLMTRRQLRAAGLRPGGHDPVAEIRWRRGRRVAYLYDPALALPVRPMTPARTRALAAAMRARRTCPNCRLDRGYCIPRSLGTCLPCADSLDLVA